MERNPEHPVSAEIARAIRTAGLSVRAAAEHTGIAYTTLDRRLKDGDQATVSELRRLAKLDGRKPADFLRGVK